MPFNGGGGGSTLPHTHNNGLVNDGGQLSQLLTDMGGVTLYSLITDNAAAVAANTANITINSTSIANLTSNQGKWSTTNANTFRTSVITGVQSGEIEEV
jgi:hypothetical protein|tara:strand:+ start:30 stop:326 length:297 start_codon:yes stop_codon:yes gene_type:complete